MGDRSKPFVLLEWNRTEPPEGGKREGALSSVINIDGRTDRETESERPTSDHNLSIRLLTS